MDLSPANVAQGLAAASSRNYSEAQTAVNQLEQWSKIKGYHSILQDLYLEQNNSLDLRLVALVQLKNGVDKFWRKGSNNALSPEEQDAIRSRLLLATETLRDSRLISVNAILVAKVARNDFPERWPTVFDDLRNLLEQNLANSTDEMTIAKYLTMVRMIIKEFATIRLSRPRAAFYGAVSPLFDSLVDSYIQNVQKWASSSAESLQAGSLHLTLSWQILRCLRRLVVVGHEFPQRNDVVRTLWQESCKHLEHCLPMLVHGPPNPVLAKFTVQLGKLHMNVAITHPIPFGLLCHAADVMSPYWRYALIYREQHSEDVYETARYSITLYTLRMLRTCFKLAFDKVHTLRLRQPKDKEEEKEAKQWVTDVLLAPGTLESVFQGLLTKFLRFSSYDYEEWTTEQEEWEIREQEVEDAFETSIRPCAERALLDLTLQYRQTVTGPLISLTREVEHGTDVFAKDAAFCALGLTASIIGANFDFNSFLTTTIVGEMQKNADHQQILRRRIAIMLAQWLPVGISNENKPLVYDMFCQLLDPKNPSNDQIVLITAGKRFADVGNDWGFQPHSFVPYASRILNSIVHLISSVEQADTKIALLNTLSTVVERMEGEVLQFADQIVSLLQPLWAEVEKERHMKKAVVNVLAKLVAALKARSGPLQVMVLPVIISALERNSETQLYLLDDALELYGELVKQSTAPANPELISVTPMLLPVLELETEHMVKTLHILESLLLLAPGDLLQDNVRQSMLAAYRPLLSVRSNEAVDMLTDNVQLMIRAAQKLSGDAGVEYVAQDLLSSGLLERALDSIHAQWAAHQSSGPRAKEPRPDAKHETNYLVILARLVLCSLPSFLHTIEAWANSHGRAVEAAMAHLLTEWFSQIDNVGNPARTKLMALALTRLLETGQPWILEKLQDLMALWTSMLLELRDGEDDTTGDTLVYSEPPFQPSETTAPEEQRRQDLLYSDPVHTINLGQWAKHHLLNAITLCGGEQEFRDRWLVNVDAEVVKAFEALGL